MLGNFINLRLFNRQVRFDFSFKFPKEFTFSYVFLFFDLFFFFLGAFFLPVFDKFVTKS